MDYSTKGELVNDRRRGGGCVRCVTNKQLLNLLKEMKVKILLILSIMLTSHVAQTLTW